MQYEQYEQEVRNLQGMIEDAHRVIQVQPVNTSNIQELQAQINHHEVQCYFSIICTIIIYTNNNIIIFINILNCIFLIFSVFI